MSTSKSISGFFLTLTILVSMLLTSDVSIVNAGNVTSDYIYLPLVTNSKRSGYTANEKLLGVYMEQYWTSTAVAEYMVKADNLAHKKHTVSGWFIGLQNIAFTEKQTNNQTNNFYLQLESLWAGGYISFINITSGATVSDYEVTDNCPIPFTADQVANGSCDRAIKKMADLYYAWVSLGGGRRAFIAPLPEMNGVNNDGSTWTSYAGDAAKFKLAYKRFVDIFASKGITRDQIWWAFAPNGWSVVNHNFENYYPGDELVDVIGFSSYNYGYCHVAIPWQRWENYSTLYEPYLSRISIMAPTKPIIIAQTGSTTEYQKTGENNVSAKNTWLQENYAYLAKQPQVLGVLYFDIDKTPWECNWEITVTDGKYTGYTNGAANSVFQYLTTQDLGNLIP